MLNWDLLVEKKVFLQAEFGQPGKPFRWLLLDGVLRGGVPERLALEFETRPFAKAVPSIELKHQVKKRGTPRWDEFSDLQRECLELLNSDRFIRLISEITGISPLYADPDLYGGGLHEILPGGYLNIHTDFNFHPKLRKLRALNLLLYLNPDWKPEWNGALELWQPDMLTRRAVIEPLMNRMVLFETSDVSFHGHPHRLACPEDRTRRSLAVYYYTDWQDRLPVRANTNYQLTPGQWGRLVSDVAGCLEIGTRDPTEIGDQLISRWQRKDVEQAYHFLTTVRTAYAYAEGGTPNARLDLPPTIEILLGDAAEAAQVNWFAPDLEAGPHVRDTGAGMESIGDDPYFRIRGRFGMNDVTRLHIKFNWAASLGAEAAKFYFDFGEGSSEALARLCPTNEGSNYFVFVFNRPLRRLRFDPIATPGPLPDFEMKIAY
jgi:hypothetical protein